MKFLADHPFWAVFIAVFMILPMIGAVIHIILKALGRRGIDNSPPTRLPITEEGSDERPPESKNS